MTQIQLFSDLKSFPNFSFGLFATLYTNPPLAGGLLVWIVPRTHHAYHYIHRSVGSQDDINNDDNDVSNDVNASLRCRVIDDYLSFGCDWSHAMYLVNYIYKFSGNSHDRPVQGRVGQLSSLLIRVVDKLYCSSNGNLST